MTTPQESTITIAEMIGKYCEKIDLALKRIDAIESSLREAKDAQRPTVIKEKMSSSYRAVTPLMLAVRARDAETMKSLFAAGSACIDTRNPHGKTALFHLDENGNAGSNDDILSLLIEEGADLNIKDNQGLTALSFYASRVGPALKTVIQQLLGAGANPDITDVHGHGAFYYACKNKNTAVMKLLIDHGVTKFD